MADPVNKKGIVVVVIFLAIILLPVGFAAYREYKLRQQEKTATPPPEKVQTN